MNIAVGVLVLLIAPPGPTSLPLPDASGPFDPVRGGQEWLADPVLPACLAEEATWPEEALTLDVPPLTVPPSLQDPRPTLPSEAESPFPRGIDARDVQAWREEKELNRIREWSSNAFFGLPLVLPQLAMESLLPRGVAIGPATFLYRSSSSSLPLVVLDQLLFHEAQFLSNVQMAETDPGLSPDFTRGQKRLLRKSFLGGFRATYVVPGMTMDQVFEVAGEQGIIGYLLAPPAAGAILFFKGIDQKVRPHDDLKIRIKLAGGEDWVRGVREVSGVPALSVELRLWDLPVGIIGSFEISSHGMIPEFLGIGTSLDAVEDLLGREAALRNPEFRER